MIKLTKLNGNPMALNSDLIRTAEASPDTMLTLINGERLIVREELDEVMERVVRYRARLLAAVSRHLPAYEEMRRAMTVSTQEVYAQISEPGVPLQFPHIEK
jgi:flagellar protein FlbD